MYSLIWVGWILVELFTKNDQILRFSGLDWSFFSNPWMYNRAAPNNFYVELIHKPHQILRFSGRDWSFCSIHECMREQCPTASRWNFPRILPLSGDLCASSEIPEVTLTTLIVRNLLLWKTLNGVTEKCEFETNLGHRPKFEYTRQ